MNSRCQIILFAWRMKMTLGENRYYR